MFGHDQLYDSLTSVERAYIRADHGDVLGDPDLFPSDFNFDCPFGALAKTRVWNLRVRSLSAKMHKLYKSMHALSSAHQAIAKVTVLIECVVLASEVEVVLVFTFLEASRCIGEDGLKDNLGRASTELEDGVGSDACRRSTPNGVEEIIGGYPGVNAYEE